MPGRFLTERRIKDSATPIDNITKFAWYDDDYEDVETWVEYSEAELEFQRELEESAIRAKFNEQLPANVSDIQDALVELGDMAAKAETDIDDIMDAIAELGKLVARLLEVRK